MKITDNISSINNITIISLVTLFFIVIIVLLIPLVHGETEKNCINFSSSHLVILSQRSQASFFDIDGCDWVVDKLLYNGSGFHLDKYEMGQGRVSDFQRFVLTK